MSKVPLSNLVNLENETTAVNLINNNSNDIENGFENTLSRDGTQPNSMTASLDMNSNPILNLPVPVSANSPLRLQDLADFIGGGIITTVPPGGNAGQVLTKVSNTSFDIDWETLPSNTFNIKNYGAIGNGTSNDAVAITNCITAAVSAGGTVVIPDGTYAHTTAINWAFLRLKVIALGANVYFKHIGTGVAHQFSGVINYPSLPGQPTQGCVGGVFGGPNRIHLHGNPAGGTTQLVLIDNWHYADMKISGRDALTIVKWQNTGDIGASAVETTFDIQISANIDQQVFSVIPTAALQMDGVVACVFPKLIVESCGTTFALDISNCIGNKFLTGTVEGNAAGGTRIGANCYRNCFDNFHSELNGSNYDFQVLGHNNTFNNCVGAATTAGSTVVGNNNIFNGGELTSMVNTGSGTLFNNVQFITSFTDSSPGTNAVVLNPLNTEGAAAPSVDNSITSIGNKVFNTANGNTFRVASNTISAVTGTGSTVVLSTSPTLVTPALGTPASGVATNLTGTAAGLTAGSVTTNANLTGDVTSVGNATTLTNAPVIAKVLTGYTSGAGTVSASDSILSAIQKLNGNDATNANLTGDVTSVGNATTLTNAPVIAKVLTGYTSGAGTVSASDSILSAIQKLNGNDATNANLTGDVTSVGNATTLTNAPVIAKVLTGYTSGAGTVSASDSILSAIQKLNGNDATNANLTGPITSSGNATSIASQTGTGTKFVVDTSPTLITPILGVATATSINGVTLDNLAWTSYSPTITPQSGTFTGATITSSGRYKQIGKTIILQADVLLTALGSGSPINGLRISLPFTAAAFNYCGTSTEIVTTGALGRAIITPSGTFVDTRKYDGTTYIVAGYQVIVSVVYEIP